MNRLVVKSHLTRPKQRKSPKPDGDDGLPDVLADYAAAYRLLETGKLGEHAGKYVAVLEGAVVGAAHTGTELRRQVSRERHVHPERLAIIHVFDEALTHG